MTHFYDVNLILHFLELFEYFHILKAMFQIKGIFLVEIFEFSRTTVTLLR